MQNVLFFLHKWDKQTETHIAYRIVYNVIADNDLLILTI
jgi:hypothetical protein